MARVDIDLDYGAILRMTTNASQELAERGAEAIRDRARRGAPKRTGALAASIRAEMVGVPGLTTTYAIGSDLDYAPYQEFGTGPIVPTSAKALRFEAGGQVVFARRTSGVPATHFMRNAAATISAKDFA